MQHNDSVLLHRRNPGDQVVLRFGQPHMLAVGALALKALRQAGEDHGHIGFGGGLDRAQELGLLALVTVRREAFDIPHMAALRFGRFQRAFNPVGIHMA